MSGYFGNLVACELYVRTLARKSSVKKRAAPFLGSILPAGRHLRATKDPHASPSFFCALRARLLACALVS